jgi:IS30 family transposase
MARKPWSFKEDRRLIELAKASVSLEEAAKQLGRSPDAIKRMALRLGLSLKTKVSKKIE